MEEHDTSILKYVRRIACYGLLSALTVHFACASTLDDIRALEAKKERPMQQEPQAAVVPRPHSSDRQYSLPDNRQFNVDDYRIVLFMQGGCHYCQQFDPQLVQLSAQTGFKVFPYTLDGQGDVSFPEAIPAPRAVLDQFFGPGNNGVTPTTWLVNVNTLQSWPLAQGLTDMNTLLQRINQALISGSRGA
jgi:type-F conjugative transfer system pilin assembly thiol-disulfide isomerase TrbB